MSNPLVHAIVFAIAVAIPGGLLVYFAWRAYKLKKAKVAKNTQKNLPDLEELEELKNVGANSDASIAANNSRNFYRYRNMDRM